MAKKQKPNFEPAAFLGTIAAGRSLTTFQKGAIIFAQADTADAVYYLQKGKIKITVLSPQGKEAVVAILGADEFFGEGCLIGQPLRLATATALMNSVVMRLDKKTMSATLAREPKLAAVFTTYLLVRNSRVEEDLVDQLFNSSEKRLARILLLMAQFGKTGVPEPIAKISQETLAEMVGTTRSRVSFFMNKFRKLGFITYNGTIEINSSLLSVVLRD